MSLLACILGWSKAGVDVAVLVHAMAAGRQPIKNTYVFTRISKVTFAHRTRQHAVSTQVCVNLDARGLRAWTEDLL